MLAHQVLEVLDQALDYTQQLERLTLDANEGLSMPSELAPGLSAQRLRLAELVGSFREDLAECDDPEAIDQWLFRRICAVWSLHVQNEGFLSLGSHLFALLSGDAAERLRQDLKDQVCILHIGCRPRVERAQRSIDSFKSLDSELLHLIAVGNPEGGAGGFRFSYGDSLLSLSCRDDYEGHCGKCLLAYTLLAMVAAPRLIYKVEDDIRLDSADLFRSHLHDLLRNDVAYAGHPVTAFPNHRQFWHGDHLGQCRNQNLDDISYQSPIGSQYADGGFAYVLGRRGLEEFAYAFVTHQAFLAIDSILFEDATVGLFLQMAGIGLTPVAPFSTGLTSERHRMQLDLASGGHRFTERQQAGLKSLRQHPLHGSVAGAQAALRLKLSDSAERLAEHPPRFAARVSADLKALVRRCIDEQERLGSFRPRRIHLASRRLGRYFDPELYATLEDTLRGLLEPTCGSKALAEIERITVVEELGPPRHDTLYLICVHLMNGELEEIQRIRAETNSLVIGWFWDNHHNYVTNAKIAKDLDVCIPSHHHGSGFLADVNPRTTYPLPLCCAQWSLPTLEQLLAHAPLRGNRSTAISGRFTDWDVGTKRRDLVRSYSSGFLHGDHVDLKLEEDQNYPYFSMSAEERFADWCQHLFSLCLPVRSDLSLRFFDAIAAGQLPIVDRELAGAVLDDLAPSLIAGRDFLLVDVSSPQDLRAARQRALETHRLQDREAASLRVRGGHLLEHRVALISEVCLEVLNEQKWVQQQQACEGSQEALRQSLDACLDALAAGHDGEALDQLATILEQPPALALRLEGIAAQWMELLAGIDGRIQAETEAAPDADQRAELCWSGVVVLDRLGPLLSGDALPSWLPTLNEQFSRYGALQWREISHAGGVGVREARRRAIVLLLRLSQLHVPCPEWVLGAARELLETDLADDQALPESAHSRRLLLKQWQDQLVVHAEVLAHLEPNFDQASRAAARRLQISVVIPFHGKVSELEVALAALVLQTFRDFEVVVVADGCAVEEDVLDGLRAQGIPASLLQLPERQGAFRARAEGAKATSGSYLWFFDHDDDVEAVFLERMLARARSSEADVVECPFWVVPPGKAPYILQRFATETMRVDAAILESYLMGESHNNLANKLIRRSLWEQAMAQLKTMGLPKDSQVIFCEDMLCTVLLYRCAHTYASTIQTEYRYLQRSDSPMVSTDPAVVDACLISLETVLKVLRPLLQDHGQFSSVVEFRNREVDWRLKNLLDRAGTSLGEESLKRVGRIQSLYD